MDQRTPIADACTNLGGATALARAVMVSPPMVTQWLRGLRRVPAERCPQIERATTGAVTCEALRPDVAWTRVPDPDWPHAAGRPLIDVARPIVAVQEAA